MDRDTFRDILIQRNEDIYIQWQAAVQVLINIKRRQRWLQTVPYTTNSYSELIFPWLEQIVDFQFQQAREHFRQIQSQSDTYSAAISVLWGSSPYYHLRYFDQEEFSVYYTDILDDDSIESLTDDDF